MPKILVIEDNLDIQTIITKILKQESFEISCLCC